MSTTTRAVPLKTRIKRTVRERDSLALLKIVNYLRFAKGMNYRGILDFINGIHGVSPLTLPEFDDMMQEGELLEQFPDGADVEVF